MVVVGHHICEEGSIPVGVAEVGRLLVGCISVDLIVDVGEGELMGGECLELGQVEDKEEPEEGADENEGNYLAVVGHVHDEQILLPIYLNI